MLYIEFPEHKAILNYSLLYGSNMTLKDDIILFHVSCDIKFTLVDTDKNTKELVSINKLMTMYKSDETVIVNFGIRTIFSDTFITICKLDCYCSDLDWSLKNQPLSAVSNSVTGYYIYKENKTVFLCYNDKIIHLISNNNSTNVIVYMSSDGRKIALTNYNATPVMVYYDGICTDTIETGVQKFDELNDWFKNY